MVTDGCLAGRGDRHRRAFTLVELLVVIAIISLLAGLLLPALEKALEAARSAACQSQMRQISLGMTQYAEDFNGYFPTYPKGPGVDWNNYDNGLLWFVDLAFYIGIEDQRENVRWEKRFAKTVFDCPSVETDLSAHPLTTVPAYGIGYGANYYMHKAIMHGWDYENGLLTAWKDPENKIALGDTLSTCLHHQVGSGNGVPNVWLQFRHLDRANLLFVDGHLGGHTGEVVPWVYDDADWATWWKKDG